MIRLFEGEVEKIKEQIQKVLGIPQEWTSELDIRTGGYYRLQRDVERCNNDTEKRTT